MSFPIFFLGCSIDWDNIRGEPTRSCGETIREARAVTWIAPRLADDWFRSDTIQQVSNIWRFPDLGTPSSHPFPNGIVPDRNHPFLGTPIYGNHHIGDDHQLW